MVNLFQIIVGENDESDYGRLDVVLPIWANEDQEIQAKYRLNWLFNSLTIELQQWFNVLADLHEDQWEPIFILKLKPCKKIYP